MWTCLITTNNSQHVLLKLKCQNKRVKIIFGPVLYSDRRRAINGELKVAFSRSERNSSHFLLAWFLSCKRSLKGQITEHSGAIRREAVRNTVLHFKEAERSISAFSSTGIKKVSQPERRRFKVSHMKLAEGFLIFPFEHSAPKWNAWEIKF